MTIAYLNDNFVPLSEARISPLDRGFLFGDGIYEVIPSHGGKCVGMALHLQRLSNGLDAIGIDTSWSVQDWHTMIQGLLEKNGNGDLGIYIQVSRGADTKRNHAFPVNVRPTVFAYTFDIGAAPSVGDIEKRTLKVGTSEDKRWRRCHIKSTSLLGNVLHYQQGKEQHYQETILFNQQGLVTEASTSNVFMVKDSKIMTPPLDHQLLPGVTRAMTLSMLKADTDYQVEQRFFGIDELLNADEVWLTSSSKEIAPVVEIDGNPVAEGTVGPVCKHVQDLFTQRRFHNF